MGQHRLTTCCTASTKLRDSFCCRRVIASRFQQMNGGLTLRPCRALAAAALRPIIVGGRRSNADAPPVNLGCDRLQGAAMSPVAEAAAVGASLLEAAVRRGTQAGPGAADAHPAQREEVVHRDIGQRALSLTAALLCSHELQDMAMSPAAGAAALPILHSELLCWKQLCAGSASGRRRG